MRTSGSTRRRDLENDFTGTFSGRYGVSSWPTSRGNPDAQTQAVTDYHNRVWNRYLTRGGVGGAADYVGTEWVGYDHPVRPDRRSPPGRRRRGQRLARLGRRGEPCRRHGHQDDRVPGPLRGLHLSPVAPSFAAVAAATPTGGAAMVSGRNLHLYRSTPQAERERVSAGAAASVLHNMPASGARSIGEGFKAATGCEPFEVRALMVNFAGALLVTWLSYVALSSFASFAAGFTSVIDVGTDIVRAILIAALILMMLN